MKKILGIFIFSGLTIFLLQNCTCSSCGQNNESYDIPPKVVRNSNEFIKAKVGENFFNDYIFLNMLESEETKDGYFMHYNLRMLDKDFVDENITFRVDTNGTVLQKYDVIGIPNCTENPEECEFNITREQAIQIAKEKELPEGIKDWDVIFRYSSKLDRYVWHILVTTSEMKTEDIEKVKGEEMIIAPNNGKILKHSKWNIF